MLSFSPASASATTTAGIAGTFTVTATRSEQAISEIDHVELDDVGGWIGGFDVVSEDRTTAVLEFHSNAGLAVGEYTGALNSYLCKDEPCRTTSAGSPFVLSYKITVTSGAQQWFAALQQYDLWTPAVDDNYAYAYTGYAFAAIDRRTGERVATIANSSFNWWGYSLNIAPVLPGDGSVVLVDGIFDFGSAHNNHLIRYNADAGSEWWRVDGNFASNPLVASGKVYVLNASSNRLEARDIATGTLLWTWVVAGAQESLPIGNLILTDNLIFLCTTTYAIDLTTHQTVWSTPRTGDLAMSSNRVLYIVSPGRIDAYNLF